MCIPDVIRENIMNHSKFSIFLLFYRSWIPWITACESHWRCPRVGQTPLIASGKQSDIIISHRPLEQTSHVKGQTWVQRCYYVTVPRKQLEDDVCDTTNCIEAIGPKTECGCMNSCLLKTFSYLYLSDFFLSNSVCVTVGLKLHFVHMFAPLHIMSFFTFG